MQTIRAIASTFSKLVGLFTNAANGKGIHERLLRLTQRLDGFVAVVPTDTAEGPGLLVTRQRSGMTWVADVHPVSE